MKNKYTYDNRYVKIKETEYKFFLLDRKNNVIDATTSKCYSYREAMKYRDNIIGESMLNDLVKIKIKKA